MDDAELEDRPLVRIAAPSGLVGLLDSLLGEYGLIAAEVVGKKNPEAPDVDYVLVPHPAPLAHLIRRQIINLTVSSAVFLIITGSFVASTVRWGWDFTSGVLLAGMMYAGAMMIPSLTQLRHRQDLQKRVVEREELRRGRAEQ